jgi:hypothetical protein
MECVYLYQYQSLYNKLEKKKIKGALLKQHKTLEGPSAFYPFLNNLFLFKRGSTNMYLS